MNKFKRELCGSNAFQGYFDDAKDSSQESRFKQVSRSIESFNQESRFKRSRFQESRFKNNQDQDSRLKIQESREDSIKISIKEFFQKLSST